MPAESARNNSGAAEFPSARKRHEKKLYEVVAGNPRKMMRRYSEMPGKTACGTRRNARIGFRNTKTAMLIARLIPMISTNACAIPLRSDAVSPRPLHVSPSMSSLGRPYDNAAMENFFGTLKTECLYRARFSSRAEVEQLVAEYIHFYNFERISLKNGLTPLEIRGKTA